MGNKYGTENTWCLGGVMGEKSGHEHCHDVCSLHEWQVMVTKYEVPILALSGATRHPDPRGALGAHHCPARWNNAGSQDCTMEQAIKFTKVLSVVARASIFKS